MSPPGKLGGFLSAGLPLRPQSPIPMPKIWIGISNARKTVSTNLQHFAIDLRKARISQGTTRNGAFYAVFTRPQAPIILAFGNVARKMIEDRRAMGRGIFSRNSIKMLSVQCAKTGAIIRESDIDAPATKSRRARKKLTADQAALALCVATETMAAPAQEDRGVLHYIFETFVHFFGLLFSLIRSFSASSSSASSDCTPAKNPEGPRVPSLPEDPRIATISKIAKEALAINPNVVDLANNRIDTLISEHLPNLCARHSDALSHGVEREAAEQALMEGLRLIRLSVDEAINSTKSEHMDALKTEVHFLRLRRNPSAELACLH